MSRFPKRKLMPKSTRKLINSAELSPVYWAEAAWVRFTEDFYALMRSQKVTRAALAQRAGVSPAYLTKVFRGTVHLTLESMCRLTHALGASVRVQIDKVVIDTQTRHVTKPGTNLFRELGFSPAEARRLHVKSRKQISGIRRARKLARQRRTA